MWTKRAPSLVSESCWLEVTTLANSKWIESILDLLSTAKAGVSGEGAQTHLWRHPINWRKPHLSCSGKPQCPTTSGWPEVHLCPFSSFCHPSSFPFPLLPPKNRPAVLDASSVTALHPVLGKAWRLCENPDMKMWSLGQTAVGGR